MVNKPGSGRRNSSRSQAIGCEKRGGNVSFEVFENKFARAPYKPRLILTRRGYFGLNKLAYELLGQPNRVILLYDPERALLGLKPSSESATHSYKVTRQGRSESYVITAKAFCIHYGIAYGQHVQHFILQEENGLLVASLEKVGENRDV